MVPVRINDAITLPFVLDSGAAEVSIPADVFLTLTRMGTIKPSDARGFGKYVLADGSEQQSKRVLLHEVRVGNKSIRDVIANVAAPKGDPLLGQSFLSRLPSWSLDNNQHTLLLLEDTPATSPQPIAPPPSISPPPASLTSNPTRQISATEARRRGEDAYNRKDYPEAVRWLRQAANQGDGMAQFDLGVLHRNGDGLPQDYGEAMRWYRRAADQGFSNAFLNIGNLYSKGLGVPQDYAEAMRWFRLAADKGDAKAGFNIGLAYANGWGMSRHG